MKYVVFTGRVLFALIFLVAGLGHFSSQSINYAAAAGIPYSSILVPFSGILSIAGALSIITGYKARAGAWLLVAFMIPVTFLMHKFWTIPDPMMRQLDMAMFMKNIGLIGGAIFIAYFGSGPLSIGKKAKTTSISVA